MADNIYDETEPRRIDADEIHALLASLREENNALKGQLSKQNKGKQEEDTGPNLLGGEPVPHHLHLTDGRVITDHGGIGTHYSETLEDGTERITRIREHYPVNAVHPNEAYA